MDMDPAYADAAARQVGGVVGQRAAFLRVQARAAHDQYARVMSNRTYRVTEIVGTSPDGIDQAIRNGVERASQTLRHLDWFEVTQVRGQIKDGQVEHFQVGMKVGFRLEDDE
jgi:flavin-binding protein dodecin